MTVKKDRRKEREKAKKRQKLFCPTLKQDSGVTHPAASGAPLEKHDVWRKSISAKTEDTICNRAISW